MAAQTDICLGFEDTSKVGYALRFISGKYQGGEFPLPSSGEVVIGRSSELDMVLVEDMVSRKHARILIQNGELYLEDLGSTNGSFVNGEKVDRAKLEESDRILIGTSIIKVVATQGNSTNESAEQLQQAKEQFQGMAAQPQDQSRKTMTGSIAEVPLTDLLQLFSTSKKSGTLSVRNANDEGSIFLQEGQIVFCKVKDHEELSPDKAFYRMLGWQTGTFDMDGSDIPAFDEPIKMSTQALLMEGVRRLDEIRRLGESLPDLGASVSFPKPFPGKLRELTPEELDVVQAALHAKTVGDIIDAADMDGGAAAETLKNLLEKGLIAHE